MIDRSCKRRLLSYLGDQWEFHLPWIIILRAHGADPVLEGVWLHTLPLNDHWEGRPIHLVGAGPLLFIARPDNPFLC